MTAASLSLNFLTIVDDPGLLSAFVFCANASFMLEQIAMRSAIFFIDKVISRSDKVTKDESIT